MPEQRALRLLVVEDDCADERFLHDVLEEAAATGVWPQWLPWQPVFVATAAEACDLAIDGAYDAILLNLSLPDTPSLYRTFLDVREIAAGTPIVILADEPDEPLESTLLREGAQDFLLKSQLDALPLARAMKRAVERQRYVNGLKLSEKPEAIATLPAPSPEESEDALLNLVGVVMVGSTVEAAAIALAD